METNTQRQLVAQKYQGARANLLMMILFTLVNIVIAFTPANVMMLFSATVPYYAVIFGLEDPTKLLLVPCILVAVIVLVVYFLCWLLSKRSPVWMIIALAMFALDSAALIGLCIMTQDFSGILDIIFHGWVLFYLISGVRYGLRLKKLPKEEALPQEQPQEQVPQELTQE